MVEQVTYNSYLKINELLSLQGGVHGEDDVSNDEMHFIIVHQAFELWFKLVLRELRCARDLLSQEKVPEVGIPRAVDHMRRVTEVFRLMAGQWKVVETLQPHDFLEFRDKLGTASGFQSSQMRELELLLGLRQDQRVGGMDPLQHFESLSQKNPAERAHYERLKRVSQEETLRDVVHRWMYRTPILGSGPDQEGDSEVVDGFVSEYLTSMKTVTDGTLSRMVQDGMEEAPLKSKFDTQLQQAADFLRPEGTIRRDRVGLLFIESYRHLPLLAWPRYLIDAVVELEESLVQWRSSHARMVERVIGRRVGSGGTSGVEYLDRTASYRIFTDLWEVRTLFIRRSALPCLTDTDYYALAVERDVPPAGAVPPLPVGTPSTAADATLSPPS